MAEESTIIKRLDPQRGLDLTSGDLRRQPGYATDCLNAMLNSQGDLVNRPGYLNIYDSMSSTIGVATWHGVGLAQEEKSEVILIKTGAAPQRLVIGTISLDTTLASVGDLGIQFRKYYDSTTSQFRAEVRDLDEDTTLLDYALGTGTGSDPDISDLLSQLNGITGVTASASSEVDTSAFAAFIENRTVTFDSDPVAKIRTFDLEAIPTSGYTLTANSSDPIPSTAKVNDVLYVGNGASAIGKYDGARWYRAGLPKPPKPTLTVNASASINGTGSSTVYRYRIQYEHTDNAGNVVESQLSEYSDLTIPTGQGANVQVNNITSSYCVGGLNPSGVSPSSWSEGDTITLTDTSGRVSAMNVGERMTWVNSSLGQFDNPDVGIETGIITDKPTSTTVEIEVDQDGFTTSGAFNYFSRMLRIIVWRTKAKSIDASQSVYYRVGTLANYSSNSTTTVIDSVSDTESSFREIFPDTPPDVGTEPPQGRFLAEYRGHLVISGVDEETDLVHFSEPGRPDMFAPAVNSFRVGSGKSNDRVTGIGSSEDYLAVSKDKSFYRVTGDLGGTFIVDRIHNSLGCVSHHTICEISEGDLAFLSHKGPWVLARGQTFYPLGPTPDGKESRMAKFFKDISAGVSQGNGASTNRRLASAVAANWAHENKYLIGLSYLSQHSTENTTLVYDYENDAFFFWDVNIQEGLVAIASPSFTQPDTDMVDIQSWLIFMDGETSGLSLFNPIDQRDEDQNDHGSAIAFSYSTSWEHLGFPSHLKKFLRTNVYSMGGKAFDLTVKQQKDWKTDVTSSMSLSFTASGDVSEKGKFREQRARSQRLVFENSTVNQRVVISGYELEVVAPYGMKIKE